MFFDSRDKLKLENSPYKDKILDNGEFDPGSGRTLAACLIHASQGESLACGTSTLADG